MLFNAEAKGVPLTGKAGRKVMETAFDTQVEIGKARLEVDRAKALLTKAEKDSDLPKGAVMSNVPEVWRRQQTAKENLEKAKGLVASKERKLTELTGVQQSKTTTSGELGRVVSSKEANRPLTDGEKMRMNAYIGFRSGEQKTQGQNLAKKINETTLESECLENVKDWLLISCFTGQRVSDFMRFEKSMISEIDGIKLLEFNQVKTGHEMTIPLHDKVIQILDKRNGNFPRPISDVKYNLYVKEVCRLAGINEKLKASKMNPKTNRKEIGVFEKWELIASHVGRRSYLSNFYNKIDTSLLMAMSGHSTEKMLLEYIGKPKSEKAVALAEKMAKIDTI
jgi:hypothetical protein